MNDDTDYRLDQLLNQLMSELEAVDDSTRCSYYRRIIYLFEMRLGLGVTEDLPTDSDLKRMRRDIAAKFLAPSD